jgi:hypothetical protein
VGCFRETRQKAEIKKAWLSDTFKLSFKNYLILPMTENDLSTPELQAEITEVTSSEKIRKTGKIENDKTDLLSHPGERRKSILSCWGLLLRALCVSKGTPACSSAGSHAITPAG